MNASWKWPVHSFNLLMGLFLVACVSPSPVYRLSVPEDNPLWVHGKEYAIKVTTGCSVGIRFSHTRGALLVFDVDVVNLSDRNLLIDPEAFYFVPRRDTSSIVKSDNKQDAVFAVNPERMIERLDKQVASEKAAETNAAIGDLAGATLDLALDVATIGSQQSEAELQDKAESRREREHASLNREIRYNTTMRRLMDERMEWEMYALRKHTLGPGEKVSGSVYFPARRGAHLLTVAFPVAGEELKFVYRQEEVK